MPKRGFLAVIAAGAAGIGTWLLVSARGAKAGPLLPKPPAPMPPPAPKPSPLPPPAATEIILEAVGVPNWVNPTWSGKWWVANKLVSSWHFRPTSESQRLLTGGAGGLQIEECGNPAGGFYQCQDSAWEIHLKLGKHYQINLSNWDVKEVIHAAA